MFKQAKKHIVVIVNLTLGLTLLPTAWTGCGGEIDQDRVETSESELFYRPPVAQTGLCGNGVKDVRYSPTIYIEGCDGDDLGGNTCQSMGFTAGTLSCTSDCKLDTSMCSTCGDGIRQGTEVCDGDDWGGMPSTCEGWGYPWVGGSLTCTESCSFVWTCTCSNCY